MYLESAHILGTLRFLRASKLHVLHMYGNNINKQNSSGYVSGNTVGCLTLEGVGMVSNWNVLWKNLFASML